MGETGRQAAGGGQGGWGAPWAQPHQGTDLFWKVAVSLLVQLQLSRDMGISHFKTPKPPGSFWPLSSSVATGFCAQPPSQQCKGASRGGTTAVLTGVCVQLFCMEPQVYLGRREMRVSAWACMFGWCTYMFEPKLRNTW